MELLDRPLNSAGVTGWPLFFAYTAEASGRADGAIDPRPARDAQAGPLRILLVDDHFDTLCSLKRLLARLGYDVLSAENMTDALCIAEQEPFDLLLSDIGLPDGSGLELVRRIRQNRPIKAIAISGFGMEDDIQRSRDAGFFEHLTKPVSLDRLQETIDQLKAQED